MLTLLRATMPGHTRVEECYWGDCFGVPDGASTAALPGAEPVETYADAQSMPTDDLDDDRAALTWGLLYENPLTPLRHTEDSAFGGMVADRTGPQAARRLKALAEWAEANPDRDSDRLMPTFAESGEATSCTSPEPAPTPR